MTAMLIPQPAAHPQVAAAAARPPPMLAGTADVVLYRLSVDQYQQMVREGIVGPADAVELLDGLLVQKMANDPPHAGANQLATDALRAVAPQGWFVREQKPIMTDVSMPEPDVVVVRGAVRDYMARHPRPQDLAMAVEVASSSVARDRGIKRLMYARAGVPIYWIVVLPERIVEVHADPSGPAVEPAYATVRRYATGESVPVVIDGREVGTVAVADLLP